MTARVYVNLTEGNTRIIKNPSITMNSWMWDDHGTWPLNYIPWNLTVAHVTNCVITRQRRGACWFNVPRYAMFDNVNYDEAQRCHRCLYLKVYSNICDPTTLSYDSYDPIICRQLIAILYIYIHLYGAIYIYIYLFDLIIFTLYYPSNWVPAQLGGWWTGHQLWFKPIRLHCSAKKEWMTATSCTSW